VQSVKRELHIISQVLEDNSNTSKSHIQITAQFRSKTVQK